MTAHHRFRSLLRDYPILAVVYGEEPLSAFIASSSRVAFVGNVDLFTLKDVAGRISANGKLVVVNIDMVPGLKADEVGIDYLTSIGVRAVATKDAELIPLINNAGSLSFLKSYLTNRSNLADIAEQIRRTEADVVQVQPAPILDVLTQPELASLNEFIAAGFIQTADDARRALDHGAFAVSTRSEDLWSGFSR